MTELQLTINNLKEAIIAADLVLQKLEKAQEALEKQRIPTFPKTFIATKDATFSKAYVIGLDNSSPLHPWTELPKVFVGRACFSQEDIRQIITGLQTLIGDNDD